MHDFLCYFAVTFCLAFLPSCLYASLSISPDLVCLRIALSE